MYAITATGFRIIESAQDAQPGESVVADLPQSLLDTLAAAANTRQITSASIRAQGEQALVDLRAFRDNPAPTNAQSVAVVKVLCRVAIGLIRMQLGKLDADS